MARTEKRCYAQGFPCTEQFQSIYDMENYCSRSNIIRTCPWGHDQDPAKKAPESGRSIFMTWFAGLKLEDQVKVSRFLKKYLLGEVHDED